MFAASNGDPAGPAAGSMPAAGASVEPDHAGELTDAMQGRRRIDLAVGIMMAHRRLTEAEATRVLVDLSRLRRVRLDDLAEELVEHQARLRAEQVVGESVPRDPSHGSIREFRTAGPAAPGPRWWG